MNIVENKDHVVLSNSYGDYHIQIDEYNKLGKDKAILLAKEEIKKKNKISTYQNKTIDFTQAREIGFCEYGIKDFCDRLKLDINKGYTIKELYEKLDAHTFSEYPNECLKLFTSKVFDKFGGVTGFLNDNRTRRTLNLVINHGNISDNILHTLAYKSTLRVVGNFEKLYSNDDRPRKAIDAKIGFIEGKITKEELSAARSAARSAAESARSAAELAWSADSADSAELAAESAARSVAWSAAAWSAAESATELNFQIDTLVDLIEDK